jgi:hypothetical protein
MDPTTLPAPWECRVASIALTISITSVPVMLYLLYFPGGTIYWLRNLNNNYGLAPSIAVLLFCTARYDIVALR